jgi:plasmid stability protein
MANLTIKGIPEPLMKWLRRSAQQHRHSLNQEVLSVLERSVGASPEDPEWFLARLRSLQARALEPSAGGERSDLTSRRARERRSARNGNDGAPA